MFLSIFLLIFTLVSCNSLDSPLTVTEIRGDSHFQHALSIPPRLNSSTSWDENVPISVVITPRATVLLLRDVTNCTDECSQILHADVDAPRGWRATPLFYTIPRPPQLQIVSDKKLLMYPVENAFLEVGITNLTNQSLAADKVDKHNQTLSHKNETLITSIVIGPHNGADFFQTASKGTSALLIHRAGECTAATERADLALGDVAVLDTSTGTFTLRQTVYAQREWLNTLDCFHEGASRCLFRWDTIGFNSTHVAVWLVGWRSQDCGASQAVVPDYGLACIGSAKEIAAQGGFVLRPGNVSAGVCLDLTTVDGMLAGDHAYMPAPGPLPPGRAMMRDTSLYFATYTTATGGRRCLVRLQLREDDQGTQVTEFDDTNARGISALPGCAAGSTESATVLAAKQLENALHLVFAIEGEDGARHYRHVSVDPADMDVMSLLTWIVVIVLGMGLVCVLVWMVVARVRYLMRKRHRDKTYVMLYT